MTAQYLVTGMSSLISVFNGTYLVEAGEPWIIWDYPESHLGIARDLEIDLTFTPGNA
jgi:hypothetical protein